MKKIPFVFPLVLMACSAPKEVANDTNLSGYASPYTIYSVGRWTPGYSVLTLTDARNNYFTIKAANSPAYVRGAMYKPVN